MPDSTSLPSEAVKSWPDRIYLQTTNPDSPACETLYRDGPYDHEGITWCIDRIDKGDVEYIRADLVPTQQPNSAVKAYHSDTDSAEQAFDDATLFKAAMIEWNYVTDSMGQTDEDRTEGMKRALRFLGVLK